MTWDCFEHKMWHTIVQKWNLKKLQIFSIQPDDKDWPRFITKKWIEIYDQLGENDNVNKEIRIKTSRLRSEIMQF